MPTTVVPTLLIGLGGIGSGVVEQVYNLLPPERRESIAVHAFDTDINDISRRIHLKGRITQTSKAITVEQYLRRADESVHEWFPHEIKLLGKKTMTDGAGQIRCVSRLAYRAAMEDGRLSDLERQITHIFTARGERAVSSVRIMIVSSLAGGTGAGIFLQTALYLRELLETRFDKTSVLVRGAFLLPDTLMNALPVNQLDNVRVNAYACLKELDAIIRNASTQTSGMHGVSIEFEYRPRQVDLEGRQNYVITGEHLPYDFCFLYDYLTAKGEQIGNLSHYIEQMVKTIYLQLFSPLSKKNFSVEDNFILELIGERGANRYCGAGTATLIYPYNDIVEYLALKWAEKSLSGEWRKLDDDFANELRQFEQDLNAGVGRQEPEIGKRYMDLLNNYAGGDKPHPFFTNIYRSTCILDERGKETGTKAERFIRAVEEKIRKVLDNDAELKQAESDCQIDEGMIRNKEKAEGEITDMEVSLEIFQHHVFRVVHELKNFVVNQVIREDCHAPEGTGGDDDFRLNVWILKRPDAMHPVAVRYLLYQIQDILEKQIAALTSENEKLKRGIEGYSRKFDLPETEDYIETAEDRVRMALKQGFFSKVFKNRFKEFVEDYMIESSQQVQRLNRYKSDYLRELVFTEINKAVAEMLEIWEHYFRNLKSVQYKLQGEINRRAGEHEGVADPTRRYAFATKEEKEKIWEEIRISLAMGNKLPDDICKRIYVSQYRKFCRNYFSSTSTPDSSEPLDKIEDMFREDVLGWCRKTLKAHEMLDINAIMALKKEGLLRGTDKSRHLKNEISKVDELAQPMILSSSSASKSEGYWGIHPDTLKELNDQEIIEILGKAENIIADEAFSRYEIIRYRNLYGLCAEDLPSFSAGANGKSDRAGIYFRAYKERIRRMNTDPGNTVTPHLDKRWHLPAYMPDLNQNLVKADEEKTEKAFLLGLIYGRLRKAAPDQKETWECYTGESGRKSVTIGGEAIKGSFYELYKAMFHNPAHVDTILDFAERQWEADVKEKGSDKIEEYSFFKGCKEIPRLNLNIAESVLRFIREFPNENPQEKSENLLGRLITEITETFRKAYGKHRENLVKKETEELIHELFESSETYQSAKRDKSYAYERWEEAIEGYLK